MGTPGKLKDRMGWKGFVGRSAPTGSVKWKERSVGLRGEREEIILELLKDNPLSLRFWGEGNEGTNMKKKKNKTKNQKEAFGRRVGDLLRKVAMKTILIWHGKFGFLCGEKHMEVDLVKTALSHVCSFRPHGQSGFEPWPIYPNIQSVLPSLPLHQSIFSEPDPSFVGKSQGISVKLTLVMPSRRTLSRIRWSHLRTWNSPLTALLSVQTTSAYVVAKF